MLDRRDPAADAEIEPTARELIGDAHVLEDPDGVVEWKELHHRPEADALGHLRRRTDEQLLIGRETEVGTVVLGEVVGREPGLVGQTDELEPVLEQAIRRGTGDALDVIEDAEGRGHANRPFGPGVRTSDVR